MLADQGSDINVIPPHILKSVLEADKTVQLQRLSETQEYSSANVNAEPLRCSQTLKYNVMLRIRHGTNMMMRGIEWMVSESDTKYAIIGREVLSAIGLDNSTLMAAACDRHDGVLNIPDLLKKAKSTAEHPLGGSVHSILQP